MSRIDFSRVGGLSDTHHHYEDDVKHSNEEEYPN